MICEMTNICQIKQRSCTLGIYVAALREIMYKKEWLSLTLGIDQIKEVLQLHQLFAS
jgi:hypothetical protein